jgi:hypothetical protein
LLLSIIQNVWISLMGHWDTRMCIYQAVCPVVACSPFRFNQDGSIRPIGAKTNYKNVNGVEEVEFSVPTFGTPRIDRASGQPIMGEMSQRRVSALIERDSSGQS